MKQLDPIFEPKSVAVVGASTREGTVGKSIFNNLLVSDFQGVLYPVNPKARSIHGVRCYPTIDEIPDTIDLAILIIPSKATPDGLRNCIEKGAKGAIVISAGFKEVGEEGRKLEDELKSVVEESGISMVGPNCLGVINTDPGVMMNASFAVSMPEAGNIAFISQSGALCTAVLDYAKGIGLGFSKFISIGNKTDVNETHLLQYLHNDPQTDVILLYVEDLSDGWGFLQAARDITSSDENAKPILAIKSGRTAHGARAASSHTGSLAGSDAVYDAIFTQAGILRADRMEELFDYAVAFSKLPVPEGPRVAIITNAGGPGIMATDAAIRSDLDMASFKDSTVKKLKEHLPPSSNFSNPIDVIGDARSDRYRAALEAVSQDPNVDSIITILTPQQMTDIEDIAREVVKACKNSDKPFLASFIGTVDVSGGVKILEENNVPHYIFPESAAKALSVMEQYRQWRKRPRTEVKAFSDVDTKAARKIVEKAKKEGRLHLPELEAMEVLKAYRIPTLESKLVKSGEDALFAAEEIGFPVALKIVSPDIIHKFDIKGVYLNLKEPNDLLSAYVEMMKHVKQKMPDATIWGANVQEMAKPGREIIIGMNRDPKFGPILMVGLGGTYVEAIRDVSFRVAPIRELSATSMIRDIRSYPLLESFRGRKASDTSALAEILERVSQLSVDLPEIEELDMNPIMVYEEGEGCRVADARIILASE
jgi:acetyltransferase